MTLLGRAQVLVRGGDPRELAQLLTDLCGGRNSRSPAAVQLVAERTPDEITFNF